MDFKIMSKDPLKSIPMYVSEPRISTTSVKSRRSDAIKDVKFLGLEIDRLSKFDVSTDRLLASDSTLGNSLDSLSKNLKDAKTLAKDLTDRKCGCFCTCICTCPCSCGKDPSMCVCKYTCHCKCNCSEKCQCGVSFDRRQYCMIVENID